MKFYSYVSAAKNWHSRSPSESKSEKIEDINDRFGFVYTIKLKQHQNNQYSSITIIFKTFTKYSHLVIVLQVQVKVMLMR